MIVASCPLRISLVGGSTDHPKFLEKFGRGSVISFPSTLRTYATLHQDYFGVNSIENVYNISYSKRESVARIDEIQNEMVKYCFEALKVPHINCSLMSDIYSVGSGLAASSAYLQALIKAVYVWRKERITDFEVCQIAEFIERKFNPLVGQQDFYGSMAGLKKIEFFKDHSPSITHYDASIFNYMDMYLLYTGVIRNSTSVLESIDLNKSHRLLDDVDSLGSAIHRKDVIGFNSIMKDSWEKKKETSPLICENQTLIDLDDKLRYDSNVLSHKLCGAGNGGYFLIFAAPGSNLDQSYEKTRKIGISNVGLEYRNLNESTRI